MSNLTLWHLPQVRTGGPLDEAKDKDLDIWAGVLNMKSYVTAGIEADPELKQGVEVPDYVSNYRRPTDCHTGVH